MCSLVKLARSSATTCQPAYTPRALHEARARSGPFWGVWAGWLALLAAPGAPASAPGAASRANQPAQTPPGSEPGDASETATRAEGLPNRSSL